MSAFPLFTIPKTRKALSISRWVDEENVVFVCLYPYTYTHTESITMEYYLAIREGNPAVCDSMNGPWEHYVKSDKSEKDKHLWSQMWNLKKLNLLKQSWMVVSRDWDGQGGGSRKIVVKRNKLLGIRWVVLGI